MRSIKQFEEFIAVGVMKKISIDKERAKSLIQESERKLISLKEHIEKIGIKEENANDYIEYCYDIILFLIRARLYLIGYASAGQGSHEAEVSYLRKVEFSEKEILFVDELRYLRNGILYYGTRCDKEYAEKVIEFTKKNIPRLKEKI